VRWIEDKSLYETKPGDRNIGKLVAPENIKQVQACQKSANVVIATKFDDTSEQGGPNPPEVSVGSVRKLPETGVIAVTATPAPVTVRVLFKDGIVSWSTPTRGLTFCEVVEEPVYMKGGSALIGISFRTWGNSGAYQKRYPEDFGVVKIYGNLPSLPPGPQTGTTTDDDGKGHVG
jgi:hypothetical protein